MKKLPDLFEVKFCSCCECVTWHAADGQCEWSSEHRSKDAKQPAPFRPWLAAKGDAANEAGWV
jgi:hypothetical protein